ncbi:MAG: J domain-containing protein [Oscillospiraceae bacterium]|nr:J domain-containing protein [Oscillospiraceae bacterium]
MSDPYKVLNISPSATDDEVKHAYRELARKYHPDNYQNNPLADLAQEKMKEINEAYDLIQKQRKSGSSSSYRRESYEDGQHYERRYSSGNTDLYQARVAISRGDITQAERILNSMQDRGAEWNYLMGIVFSRRGWMDEAKRCLENACRMDPTNDEYRDALNMFASSGYHPEGYRGVRTMNYDKDVCSKLCSAGCCFLLTGGRCCIC